MKLTFFGALLFLLYPSALVKAQNSRSLLSRIEIEGNHITKEHIILREIPLKPGIYYTGAEFEHLADQGKALLINLNLFQTVAYRIDTLNGDSIQLVLELAEKWYVWPLPFIEYADRNFTQWQDFRLNPDRTNYGLYLFWYNAFGRNQSIKLSLGQGYTRTYGIEYRVPPGSTKKNWGWSASAFQRNNREVWYDTRNDQLQFLRLTDRDAFRRTEIQGQVQYRKAYRNTHSIQVRAHLYQCDSVLLTESYNKAFLGNQTELRRDGIEYRFVHEGRDNRYYPLKGQFIDLRFSADLLNKENSLYEAFFSASWFEQWNHWLYSGVHGTFRGRIGNDGREIPYWLNRNIGYDQQIRGYERYVVDGSYMGIIKTSLKSPLWQNKNISSGIPLFKNMPGFNHVPFQLFGGVFADFGQVWQETDNTKGNRLPGSFLAGAGLHLDANFYVDKLIRFEASYNRLGETNLFLNFSQAF